MYIAACIGVSLAQKDKDSKFTGDHLTELDLAIRDVCARLPRPTRDGNSSWMSGAVLEGAAMTTLMSLEDESLVEIMGEVLGCTIRTESDDQVLPMEVSHTWNAS